MSGEVEKIREILLEDQLERGFLERRMRRMEGTMLFNHLNHHLTSLLRVFPLSF